MASPGQRNGERLTSAEAAILSEQVAGLARASLPLPSGLRALSEEMPAGRLRRTLAAVAESLEHGMPLEEAIAARRGALPAPFRGLVLAGERTGHTGEVLGRFAAYARIGPEVRRKLWLQLFYPAVTLLFAAVLVLFVLTVLVAGFEQIYADFGIPLPGLSIFLIELSRTLRSAGPRLLEGAAALGVLLGVILLVIGPAARRNALTRLPLLGPIWRWTALAEFCHLLGLLLESELPLPEAVPLAAEGVNDAAMKVAAGRVAEDLGHGQSLALAIARRPFFPEGLDRIIAWAEQHRTLPEALHVLGEMFEARADDHARLASTICNVMTVLAIPFGLGLVVIGVMAPLFILIQKLSG